MDLAAASLPSCSYSLPAPRLSSLGSSRTRFAWKIHSRGGALSSGTSSQRWAATAAAAAASEAHREVEVPRLNAALDDELSKRPLELDGAGYFIIYVDRERLEIVAEFFTNIINQQGLACDPVTGDVIPCTPGYCRPATKTYRGRTAKEISVEIIEREQGLRPVTHLEHANYLGREFARAEAALLSGQQYVQD